jgi:multidrug resistance efflux pump
VYAPVNGYVTNLVLDVGDFADVGKPVLAIVDSDSFRVEAYLEETKLNFVKVGDSASVILMSGAPPIKGRVDSIARGIGDTQTIAGYEAIHMIRKGQACRSAARAKVSLLHRFILGLFAAT